MGLQNFKDLNLNKLKTSSVNQIVKEPQVTLSTKDKNEEVIFTPTPKAERKLDTTEIKKASVTTGLDLNEVEALKLQVEQLKSLKGGRVRYSDFKAHTFRVEKAQYKMIDDLEKTFPPMRERLESTSKNSIVRGLLKILEEHERELDFSNTKCDLDILNELKRVIHN
ncbi:hypothetical protein N9B72_00250 [Bacteriovoracaceae bacterium]|nr:hypothetical protein [Bacteriovoracaceae bacterium]